MATVTFTISTEFATELDRCAKARLGPTATAKQYVIGLVKVALASYWQEQAAEVGREAARVAFEGAGLKLDGIS